MHETPNSRGEGRELHRYGALVRILLGTAGALLIAGAGRFAWRMVAVVRYPAHFVTADPVFYAMGAVLLAIAGLSLVSTAVFGRWAGFLRWLDFVNFFSA